MTYKFSNFWWSKTPKYEVWWQLDHWKCSKKWPEVACPWPLRVHPGRDFKLKDRLDESIKDAPDEFVFFVFFCVKRHSQPMRGRRFERMRDEKERERPTWRGGSGPLEIRPMASLSHVKGQSPASSELNFGHFPMSKHAQSSYWGVLSPYLFDKKIRF